ncbi:MAG: ABC transporter substrate-binding protein [Gammaproteobacteria bacterium]|nr:ABC transporter substrate-binding protein [Gammaproteobacteria bacterium]MBU1466097.1 ABC transporter substrate-binding protein [Gammaproteobacteria bacterium]MBU2024489.1 ABC transporter substrate-binding protein [Gammaproteobacteria bacterium]MBU2237133.1 ABC transporter substrate-binding protein [Gammaproteobacteria bacterium]MBU2413536.1 ABC transporter substrate-binding protein [Gammaproteobacteria bacterium]
MSRKLLIFVTLMVLGSLSSTFSFAQRVVSIGGTVTEIVYLLGADKQLVASDTSSIYPDKANQMPKVGYQRTLSAEGVLSVHPELLLITPSAGPAKVLQQLKDTGVKIVTIDSPDTKQGIFDKVSQVAHALDQEIAGKQAIDGIKQAFDELAIPESWKKRPPRLLFVLQMGGAPMVAGQGTAPDALFHLAGAINAVNTINGYKALTPEAILLAQPDAIVVTQQGLTRAGEQAIWSLPGMASTPAAKAQRLISLDALLALGLGPRTPQSIQFIHQQLEDWAP